MKKESLERLAVILGIALLAGVVALIAACDTGGGLDACEELTGDWTVTVSELESPNPCGTPGPGGLETTIFRDSYTVSGGQIKMDRYYVEGELPDSVTADIACNGREFTISWEGEPYPVRTDCYRSQSMEINGTFDSLDRFSATQTFSSSHEGTDCEPNGFPEYCYGMAGWEAVRQ